MILECSARIMMRLIEYAGEKISSKKNGFTENEKRDREPQRRSSLPIPPLLPAALNGYKEEASQARREIIRDRCFLIR